MAAKLKALLQWCKVRCDGYRDVQITNFTSSFKSGLAFCAIIHRYRPDLIDYDSLRKEDCYENNKLAFQVAQDALGIPALLDAEDMVTMTVPDKLCIVTYVSQYHNYFKDKEPAPAGATKRTAAKRPQPERNISTEAQNNKKPAPTKVLEEVDVKPGLKRQATYGDTCSMCKDRVFLMERHIQDNKLYHRRCFRELERSQLSASLKRGLKASEAYANQENASEENKENHKKFKPADDNDNRYSSYVIKTARVGRHEPEDIPNPFKSQFQRKGFNGSSPSASPRTYRQLNSATTKTYTAQDTTHPNTKPYGESYMPYKSTQQTTSTNDSPQITSRLPASNGYSSKLGDVKDAQTKHSLLENLTRIRQAHGSDKSESASSSDRPNGLQSDNSKRKSALTVNLDGFPKKDPSKPSTAAHKVGLQSPTGYKSIFGDSNLSLSSASTKSDVKDIANSPHKSILKHGQDTSPGDSQKRAPSSEGFSTYRSILKNNSRSNSQERRGSSDLSTTPPRSILKSKSPVETGDDSGFSQTSMSPPRSILKLSDDSYSYKDSIRPILKKGGDDDSDIEPPRPILRKSSDDIDLDQMVEANLPTRPILKKHSIDKSDDEFPKPILKHGKDAEKVKPPSSLPSSQPTSIFGLLFGGKQNEKADANSTSRTAVFGSDSGAATKPAQTGKLASKSGDKTTSSAAKPSFERDEKSDTVPSWQLEAQKRQAARGNQYDDPEYKKTAQTSGEHKSSSSSTDRFLRNNGVFFSNSPRPDKKLDTKIETPSIKSDSNTTKRGSTVLSILPKSTVSPKKIDSETPGNTDKNKWKPLDDKKSTGLTTGADTRPAWQIEAERRRDMRNGHYPDPEKDPASVRPKVQSTTEPKADPSRNLNSKDSSAKPSLSQPSDRYKTAAERLGLNSNTQNRTTPSRPNNWQTQLNGTKNISESITSKNTPQGLNNDIKKDNWTSGSKLNGTQPKYQFGLVFKSGTDASKKPFPLSTGGTSNSSKDVNDLRNASSSNTSGTASVSASSSSSPSELSPTGYRSPPMSPIRTGNQFAYTQKVTTSSPKHTNTWTSNTSSAISSTSRVTNPSPFSREVPLSPSPAASPAPLPRRTDSPFSDKSSRSSPLSSPRSSTPTSPSHNALPGCPNNVSLPTSYGASKLLSNTSPQPYQQLNNKFQFPNRDPVDKYRIATGRYPLNQQQSSGDSYKIYDNAARHYQSMAGGSNAGNWKSNTAEPFTHFGNRRPTSPTSPGDSYSLVSDPPKRTPALRPPPGTTAYVSREPQRKKVPVNEQFIFASNEFDPNYSEVGSGRSKLQDRKSPNLPPRSYTMTGRPLPAVPLYDRRRRTVSAEGRIPPQMILVRLESLDEQLRLLEEEGRQLELQLRECEDEALENELLNAWFDLINKKNGLVRDEVDLVYRQRQQELEDIHEELEYELRLLLEQPGNTKTASDKVREEALLQELLHTVSERNSIIDSMEEDRKRYLEEDEVIAQVMKTKAAEGYQVFSEEEDGEKEKKKSKKKKKKRFKKKSKKKKKDKEKEGSV